MEAEFAGNDDLDSALDILRFESRSVLSGDLTSLVVDLGDDVEKHRIDSEHGGLGNS